MKFKPAVLVCYHAVFSFWGQLWETVGRTEAGSKQFHSTEFDIRISWRTLNKKGIPFRIYHCSKWLGKLYSCYSPNTIWNLLMSVFKSKLPKVFRRYLQWNCETAFSLMVPFVSSTVAQQRRHKGTATLDGCAHRKRSLLRALLTMELPLIYHHLLWTVFCFLLLALLCLPHQHLLRTGYTSRMGIQSIWHRKGHPHRNTKHSIINLNLYHMVWAMPGCEHS